MKIFIEDLAEKMEEVDDNWQSFLNRNNGVIIDVLIEYLTIAEELNEDADILNRCQDWEREFIEIAIEIEENGFDYVELPNQFDINEYSIMEDFIGTIEEDRKREILYKTIVGKGAFRRFKDKIYHLGVETSWFTYKYKGYCEIAEEWCEENEIQYAFREHHNE